MIKHKIHENKQNDHHTWKALTIAQILSTYTSRDIWRSVRRIFILVLDYVGGIQRRGGLFNRNIDSAYEARKLQGQIEAHEPAAKVSVF